MFLQIEKLVGDDDIARELGNMIVAWSYAEHGLIWTLDVIGGLNGRQAQDGFYRIPTFESRIKFIVAIAEDWDPGERDKAAILKEIAAIAGLSLTRNAWVHGIWMADVAKGGGGIFVGNGRAKPPNWYKPVKAHDIRHHNEVVVNRTNGLLRLVDPLRDQKTGLELYLGEEVQGGPEEMD